MENLEQKAQENGKYELKEYIGKDQVKGVLKQWLIALEQNEDLVIEVKGKQCKIPKEVLGQEKIKLEYEVKNGEYEFELELKWTPSEKQSLIQ